MDGLRINPGTIGTAAIQNVAPEFVERVEIVKGPRSTLYGSDAIGGVINVITRGAEDGSSVQAGFGSFDTKTASFNAGFGDESTGASIAGAWFDSEGFPTRAGDDTDRGNENTSFTASAHADVGTRRARAARLVRLRHHRVFGIHPGARRPGLREHALAVTAEFAPTEAWSSRLMVGHAEDDLEQNQSDDFIDTERNTVDWQNDIALSESQHPDGRPTVAGRGSRRVFRFGFAVDAYASDVTTSQVYLQAQGDFGRASRAARRRLHRSRNFWRPRDRQR